jgi:hypothetical protein
VLEALGPRRRPRVGPGTGRHACRPACAKPRRIGLAGFGRPEGFNERQVRRWRSSSTRPAAGQ